jgi:hypothetical protein
MGSSASTRIPRLRHGMLALLSFMSAVAGSSVAYLWISGSVVPSFLEGELIVYGTAYSVSVEGGQVIGSSFREYAPPEDAPASDAWRIWAAWPYAKVAGFGAGSGATYIGPDLGYGFLRRVACPTWFALTACCVFPATSAVRLKRAGRRRRRLREGLCIYCGYDLRASRSCCPECGQPRTALAADSDRGGRLHPSPLPQ